MCVIYFSILAMSIIQSLITLSLAFYYVVQAREHPLMAIAYLFHFSVSASLAGGGNPPLAIRVTIALATVIPGSWGKSAIE